MVALYSFAVRMNPIFCVPPRKVLSVVTLFLVGCSDKASVERGTQGPTSSFLLVSPAEVSAGNVWPGQYFEAKVNLTNIHPLLRLRISQATNSCGCTVTQLQKEFLAPGESAEVSVRILFGEELGEVVTSVAFEWQLDGEAGAPAGIEKIPMSGNVVDLVRILERTINLGHVDKRRGVVRGEYRVAPGNSQEVVRAMTIRTSLLGFTGECHKEKSGNFVLKYQFDPSRLSLGAFHEPLELAFFDESSERGVRRVFVSGSVSGAVRASPTSLTVYNMETGETKEKILQVFAADDSAPVRLNGKVASAKGLAEVASVGVEEDAPLSLNIMVKLPEQNGSGRSAHDVITIPVKVREEEETIKVPLVIFAN